ncbi:MAG TPA: hypothetical protein VGM02_11515 [Acidobacteriaceae bacterium]|jgi:DNA-binding response OmpR family regulator
MPLTLVLSLALDPALLLTRNLVLQSAGYVVVPAASIREAVERFHGGDFDLIVLGHSVPARDRQRLACLIRASGSHVPVVAVSGRPYECDEFADVTLEDDPDELLAGIEELLLKHARLWSARMAGHGDEQKSSSVVWESREEVAMASAGAERQQKRLPAGERSFGLLALPAWHAASG